jgi:hypothetical protein
MKKITDNFLWNSEVAAETVRDSGQIEGHLGVKIGGQNGVQTEIGIGIVIVIEIANEKVDHIAMSVQEAVQNPKSGSRNPRGDMGEIQVRL